MKKFLSQILIFGISFLIYDRLFYPFLIISPKLEKDRRLEYVLEGNMNKDLIVIGSSRGARNVIACQLEDSLNISCYNLSYPGSDITFHEFILRTLLKYNKKPRIVLLVVDDPSELLPNETIKFRFDRLYPLVKHDYINNEMIKRGEKSFLSKFIILARINKSNFILKKKRFSAFDSLMSCGSMPISFQRKNIKLVFKKDENNYKVEDEIPEKLIAFKKFQAMCVSNRIKLFLVYPPNFKTHNTAFERRLKELSYPEVSSIIYDTTNPIYKKPEFFFDASHLQRKGAVVFTNEIIEQLNRKIYR